MEFHCTQRIDWTLVDEQLKEVVLYNDDNNTFDYVIDSLQLVCKHDLEQAHQCTFLAHYTGKCSVKVGNFLSLEKIVTRLKKRGLIAEIA